MHRLTTQLDTLLLEEDEEEDVEEAPSGGGTSPTVAFINATKCFAGASSFELPFALMEGGLVAGTIGTAIFAILSFSVFCTLVECGHLVRGIARPSFLQVGSEAYGPWIGRGAILFGMAAMTLGVCGTYLDFIGQTLADLVTPHVPWLGQRLCTLIVLPFATALSLVRSQKAMALTSALGILAVLLGCGFVIYDATTRPDVTWHSPLSKAYGPFLKWKTYGGFMGNAGYLYLISTAVLPIEQQMKRRRHFKAAFGASILFTTLLNLGFGVVAAMAYSTTAGGVKSVVILNLRPGALAACVKIFVALNQLFTYGLFLTPFASALERMLFTSGAAGPSTAKLLRSPSVSPTAEEGYLRGASLTERELQSSAGGRPRLGGGGGGGGGSEGEFFMYRYISRESFSQFDSLPLTSLTYRRTSRSRRRER